MQYNISKIGEQIASRRKEMNLTQDELAEILGVTPQAVSKWERCNGLPDIALLPNIASALGLSLDELFGLAQAEGGEDFIFPEEYKGLNKVLSFGDLACYSDLEVAESSDVMITFKDGSSANLANGELNFRGSGNIELVRADALENEDQVELNEEIPSEKYIPEHSKSYSPNVLDDLEGIDTLRIENNGFLDFRVNTHAKGQVSWSADDLAAIDDDLEIYSEGNVLVFAYRPRIFGGFFNMFGSSGGNCFNINLPKKQFKYLDCEIRGSSDIFLNMDFERSEIELCGSGDVRAQDLGDCRITINGSGDLQTRAAGPLDIHINGSGDLDIEQVSETLSVKINGSGDVDVAQGFINELTLQINGSGDFDAAGLSTQNADISMQGVGDAVIGQIRGESRERVGRISTLKVLKRGQ